MVSYKTAVLLSIVAMAVPLCHALVPWRSPGVRSEKRKTHLRFAMKRPILDQVASFLFQLETDRVEKSSVVDEKGRLGEPMEWSERESVANKFSEFIASNDVGYDLSNSSPTLSRGNLTRIKRELRLIRSSRIIQ